jgi:hypothetical protein
MSDLMKARRDWQKVRKERKKHVSARQRVLSTILCELSAIPRTLSTTLQSFEVDQGDMTDTLGTPRKLSSFDASVAPFPFPSLAVVRRNNSNPL